jgi:hypothetical protein
VTTYQVRVDAINQWTVDHNGIAHTIVERVCGHQHRSVDAARRCERALLGSRCGVCGRVRCGHNSGRTHSAAWHRCYVAEV